MAETKISETGNKWIAPVAIGLGGAGVVAGLYFFTKKPKGADPGDTIKAKLIFDYYGEGGEYILQVSLGKILIGNFFDHVEGLTWTLNITLPVPETIPQKWEFLVLCPIPDATESGTYDAEATIRKAGMDWLDYLVKTLTQSAVNVRKL